MLSVDLNCDMGEGMDNDALLMPLITSANIACGYHAGDSDTMKATIELAIKYNVAVGAHPGFADKANFGRTEQSLSGTEIYNIVTDQLHILQTVCASYNVALHHVKPHGALYNMAAIDSSIANAIARAVYDVDKQLILYGLSGSASIAEANQLKLTTASEVFADRTYRNDGSLTPRSQSNALITETDKAIEQVLNMVRQKQVTTVDNIRVHIKADTVCLHGDGAHAVEFAMAINQQLRQHNIEIKAL
jgi:UPF0271 protein